MVLIVGFEKIGFHQQNDFGMLVFDIVDRVLRANACTRQVDRVAAYKTDAACAIAFIDSADDRASVDVEQGFVGFVVDDCDVKFVHFLYYLSLIKIILSFSESIVHGTLVRFKRDLRRAGSAFDQFVEQFSDLFLADRFVHL